MDAAAQYALAYALTTTAGIRAVLPLALVSLAAHFGYVHLPPPFHWLGTTTVSAVLVALAVVELLADKIPLVDHGLHFVQLATKPTAAAILAGGVTQPQNHDVLVGLMIAGALNALGVHLFTSSVRVGSTATTGGLGNPFISTFEDAVAIGTTVLALVAPFLAAALALVLVIILVRIARGAYRRVRTAVR